MLAIWARQNPGVPTTCADALATKTGDAIYQIACPETFPAKAAMTPWTRIASATPFATTSTKLVFTPYLLSGPPDSFDYSVQNSYGDVLVNLTATITPGSSEVTLEAKDEVIRVKDPNADGGTRVADICIDVCDGESVYFDGNTTITFTEQGPADNVALELAGSDGATMEAWFKTSAVPSDAYLIFKGSPSTIGKKTSKTFSMVLKNATSAYGSIYLGLGNTEEVTGAFPGPISDDQWHHLAVSYTGSSISMYLDGTQVGTNGIASPTKAVPDNKYDNPVVLGFNYVGLLDEVKLLTHGRSAEEVADFGYCPPTASSAILSKVAAYFPLNVGPGGNTSFAGIGAACYPYGSDQPCLQGTLVTTSADAPSVANLISGHSVDDTPLSAPGEGPGFPSAKYSIYSGPGLTEWFSNSEAPAFTITAKDKCEFNYVDGSSTAFSTFLTRRNIKYFDAEGPSDELPMGYPTETADQPMSTRTSVPNRGFCVGGSGLGNTYNAKILGAKTGPHHMQILAEMVPGTAQSAPIPLVKMDIAAGEPSSVVVKAMPTEAGATASVSVTLLDNSLNIVHVKQDLVVTVMPDGDPTIGIPSTYTTFNAATGEYTVAVIAGVPGIYTFIASVSTTAAGVVASTPTQLEIGSGAYRHVLTDGMTVPEAANRFEHAGVVYKNDLYVVGGAAGKTRHYLSDVLKLSNVDGQADKLASFSYRVPVAVKAANTSNSVAVMMELDTAALVSAGKLRADCADLLVTDGSNGATLPFVVDSFPGCNNEKTLVFARLGAGALASGATTIDLYYGAARLETSLAATDLSTVFDMYESFEDGDLAKSQFSTPAACENDSMFGEVSVTCDHIAMHGKCALHIPAKTKSVVSSPPMGLDTYVMRAWLYDNDAVSASHYASVDYAMCARSADGIEARGLRSASVGVNTLCHATEYCSASPWISSPMDKRSAAWQLLEIKVTSATEGTISINGVMVQNLGSPSSAKLEAVTLSAGHSHTFVNGTGNLGMALWDAVYATAYPKGLELSMGAEEPVSKLAGSRTWTRIVPSTTTNPPPRNAHSAVLDGDTIVVFGGERSAFHYNDVWSFNITTQEWTFHRPGTLGDATEPEKPAPRSDHAAVMVGGMMIVSGGSGGRAAYSDTWAFDAKTNKWTKLMEDGASLGARYGHAAAAVSGTDTYYVFGGLVSGQFTTDFMSCKVNATFVTCTDLSSTVPEGMAGRIEHIMAADAEFVYVHGGSSSSQTMGIGSVWKYNIAASSWTQIVATIPDAPENLRYEHVGAKVTGGMVISYGAESSGTHFIGC